MQNCKGTNSCWQKPFAIESFPCFVNQVNSIITRKEDSVCLALKRLNTEVEFLAFTAHPSQAEKKQCYVMEPLEAKKPIESINAVSLTA